MAGVVPKFGPGPVTYEVVEAVKGGQVVEGRANSKIGVAAAGSTTVLGVASKDAAPSFTAEGTTAQGFPSVDTSAGFVTPHVAVYSEGHLPVEFTAAVAFGKAVKAAAGGKVAPWVSGTDAADLIIGTCREPGGITASGQFGLIKISR